MIPLLATFVTTKLVGKIMCNTLTFLKILTTLASKIWGGKKLPESSWNLLSKEPRTLKGLLADYNEMLDNHNMTTCGNTTSLKILRSFIKMCHIVCINNSPFVIQWHSVSYISYCYMYFNCTYVDLRKIWCQYMTIYMECKIFVQASLKNMSIAGYMLWFFPVGR